MEDRGSPFSILYPLSSMLDRIGVSIQGIDFPRATQSYNHAVRQVGDAQAIRSNRDGALLTGDFDGHNELFADKPCGSVIRGTDFQPLSLFIQHGYLRA
jgi:hypothetical protein